MNTKRAEELAFTIGRMAIREASHDITARIGIEAFTSKIAALLLAEMRKEREACAERAESCIDQWRFTTGTTQDMSGLNLRAAILREEE